MWDKARTASENAKAELPKLAAEYFEEGRKATHSRLSPAELHRFRLKTKRFRYTLEIFGTLYGPAFERCLSRLREVQNHLGAISDFATMRDLFHDEPALAAEMKRRGDRRAAEFRAYWKGEFDAEGEEKRWQHYLGTFAGRKRAVAGVRRRESGTT